MEKMYKRMKFIWAFFFVIASVACSDDKERCVPNEEKSEDSAVVLSSTRSYEEALVLAQESIGIVDRAETRAASLRRIRAERGQCVTEKCTRNGESTTDTLMYVFNFENNAGFSVIAANRAIAPVLAVTERGSYTHGVKTGVENFDYYMDLLTAQVAATPTYPTIPPIAPIQPRPIIKTEEVDIDKSKGPLVSTRWSQSDFYGRYFTNNHCGCVTTAVAQIMSVYRKPETIACTISASPLYGQTVVLDWDAMTPVPRTTASQEQMAVLMREIGTEVGAKENGSKGTGAYSKDVPKCVKAFGYSCSTGLQSFESYRVRVALNQGRPVYVEGWDVNNPSLGHAWVADGYHYTEKGTRYYEQQLVIYDDIHYVYDYVLVGDDVVFSDLLHYNWGWGGLCDGYFESSVPASAQGYTFSNLKMILSIIRN